MKTKCVHCLKEFETTTDDHLFPESWYPETTPENIEKWKFPSCKECNRFYDKIEDELMCLIDLCLDPDDPAGKGIAKKALRSINPDCARNDADRKHREARKTKLYAKLFQSKEAPTTGVLPNFGKSASSSHGYLSVSVSEKNLKHIGEKFAKGLIYIFDDKQYISEDYEIKTFFCNDEDVKDIVDKLGKVSKTVHRGPGFKVTRVIPIDDPQVSISIVEIWGRLKFYICVDKKE